MTREPRSFILILCQQLQNSMNANELKIDKCLVFRVIHVVYSATFLFLTTNSVHVLECCMSRFSNLIRELQVSKPCRHLRQTINTCLPSNTDNAVLFTHCHCHRNVIVLCLVCLLVAIVDGMFEQKGRLTLLSIVFCRLGHTHKKR